MKQTIDFLLSRRPSLYQLALRAVRSSNTEKMTFLRLVKNGSIIFDVGANRGDYTMLFSNIVGRNGMVYTFEPIPPTFSILSQRVKEECRFQNVLLNNCTLGNYIGEFNIQVPSSDFGQASLKSHATGS